MDVLDLDPCLLGNNLFPDDLWTHIEMIADTQTQSFPVIDTDSSTSSKKNYQVKYDCMWNGHSKGPMPPGDVKPPVMQVPSQQSLLKPDLKLSVDPNTVVPMMPSYFSIQTPPISDDEDSKPTNILRSLQNALSENELDDGDLSDYFREDGKNWGFFDEELEEGQDIKPDIDLLEVDSDTDLLDIKPSPADSLEQQQNEMRAYYAATDHSYHKGTTAIHSDHLGLDTPSDSEEEIDVVSLGEKFNITKAGNGVLPTNPSTKDRQQIQRTMQSRFPQGLKTILPVKKFASVPKKAAESKGGATRQCKKGKQNQKGNKRRYGFLHNSDNEQEPLEKRHLHNNMERQRRIDLRNLFNDLKKMIPELSKRPRVAKVHILRAGACYCTSLVNRDLTLVREIERAKKHQMRLRVKLARLRREVAAKR